MRTAILVASKSQFFQTIDNVMIRGSGLSVTQFLRGSPVIRYVFPPAIPNSLTPSNSIDDFIYNLKTFIDSVRLDQSVITDCKYIIREFALSSTIFSKFEEYWNRLGIRDK